MCLDIADEYLQLSEITDAYKSQAAEIIVVVLSRRDEASSVRCVEAHEKSLRLEPLPS